MASLEDTMTELSALACACLQVAYEFILSMLIEQFGSPRYTDIDGETKEGQFVILGLGKLGGRELNFSSDIDLMYLYSSDKGETSGGPVLPGQSPAKLPLPQFYTRLAELMTRAINEPMEGGLVFRVDLRLRPEGSKGNLANSLRSAEIYYESWGRPWERAALIKARPVAGNKELGERFLEMVQPFIYRKYLDYTMIEEIREMKQEIDRRVAREELKGKNIKLGIGGIREIEFFIHALQLINGGKDPAIRGSSTLKALAKLKERKYLQEDEYDPLEQAYKFLRQVEHKIQIVHTRQTHLLPRNPAEILQLGRRLGYRNSQSFLVDLENHTGKVKDIYGRLFYAPPQQIEQRSEADLTELLREDLPRKEILNRLERCGFKEPVEAFGRLRLLKEGPLFVHFSARANRLLRKISPIMLQEILKTPDPDAALVNLEGFLSTVGARTTFLSLLGENPPVVKLLVRLFGGSDYLAKLFIHHPELLDSLVRADAVRINKPKLTMAQELEEALRGLRDYEDKLDELRRFKNGEILRLGMAALAGELSHRDETRQITNLAEVCLQKAYEISSHELEKRHGYPLYKTAQGHYRSAHLTIIGLGRLGAREMSYNSDLDIIFIYSREGETSSSQGPTISNHEYFVKLAQKIITTLSCLTKEGHVFRVDTRLRPSGNAGPLVSSFQAFQLYHKEKAQVWEHQVLLKSRWVAGDRSLGARVLKLIQKSIYQRPLTTEDIQDIHRLRLRMEDELAQETDTKFHLKLGRGGVIDIQFIVQLLQLRYGYVHKQIRERETSRALKKLYDRGLLPEKDYSALMEAWEFLTEIGSKVRISQDRSLDALTDDQIQLEALAKRLAYSYPKSPRSGQELLEKYKHHTNQVRQVYLHYFT
jgi:glutamate-ammonia-ligase adenylyltransferase